MLLYGLTLDLASVKSAGIRTGIGSDWSPTGSKNLFGELKVARIVSQSQGGLYTDREIIQMATRQAADILGWNSSLGSLEEGKYADFTIISGRQGDPYEQFLNASEKRISLVAVHGVPRYGWPSLMNAFGGGTETVQVGSSNRVLDLSQTTADPVVAGLTLAAARERLRDGLANLNTHGENLASRINNLTAGLASPQDVQPAWMILLDNDQLEAGRQLSTPVGPLRSAPISAPMILEATADTMTAIKLDDLTVADDSSYFDRLQSQINLDSAVKNSLEALY